MVQLLRAGADKVAINSAAVADPDVISRCAAKAGSQCVVVASDARKTGNHWEIFTHGGRKPTGINAVEFARLAESKGAGEILLTSMDKDGTKSGFDLPLTRAVTKAVNIPLIASGGAATMRTTVEITVPKNEAQMPSDSARPGWPARAMGKASKVVATEDGVPGMPRSAAEMRPPV